MASGFSYLPVELEDNVLVFIKSFEDRKTCRSVSRRWNKLMSSILFRDFNTDLQITSSKTLVTLLNPNNAILPNIRQLGIYPSLEDSTNGDEDFASDNEDSASDDKYCLSGDRETRFQDLVSALPRGRLTRFSSHFKIRFHMFQLLVTNQPMIQDLEFDLNIPLPATNKFEDPLAFSSLPHLTGIVPDLQEIKYVTGHAGYYDSNFVSVFDNLRFIIRNCPKLTGLSISILDRMHNFGDPVNVGELLQAPTDTPMFMNLTKLEFYDISFAQQQTAFLKHINAEKIVTLEINKCYEIAPLLRGIADIFSVGGSTLRFLEVTIAHFTTESDEDLYSIETLLKSCLGLEGLYLDVGRKSRVDKTCIMHHGPTLKSLGVGTGHSCAQECYSPQELTSILTACPKLKDLALNLPKADLGKIDLMGIGFRLSPQNPGVDVRPEFEATLDALSAHPTLHIVRMLSFPTIDYGSGTSPSPLNCKPLDEDKIPFCTAMMQNFANQVIQYMARSGSNVQVFDTSPHNLPPNRPPADENLHRWPEYTYTKGRMIDARGVERVVAVPLSDPLQEMGDLKVFSWKVYAWDAL